MKMTQVLSAGNYFKRSISKSPFHIVQIGIGADGWDEKPAWSPGSDVAAGGGWVGSIVYGGGGAMVSVGMGTGVSVGGGSGVSVGCVGSIVAVGCVGSG